MPTPELEESSATKPPGPEAGQTVKVLVRVAGKALQWSLAVLLGEEVTDGARQYSVHVLGSSAPATTVSEHEIELLNGVGEGSTVEHPGSEPAAPETLYEQGVRQAEVKLGAEVRDYDRVLHGLSHLLTSRGLAVSASELHQRFHYPLDQSLTGPPGARLPFALEQVLKEELRHLFPHRCDLTDERQLEVEVRAMQRSLNSPNEQDTLASHLEQARKVAEDARRRAEVVECLLGADTDRIRARRSFADRLEHSAALLEERARKMIDQARQRIDELPRERARSLRRINELRLRPTAFEGNMAALDADFITDSHLMVRKSAIKRRDRAERLAAKKPKHQPPEPIRQEHLDSVFQNAVQKATENAELLGYLSHAFRDQSTAKEIPTRIALAVTARDQMVFLAADLVRYIDSLLGGFDAVVVDDHASPVVFLKNQEPVAILMPVRRGTDDLRVDLAIARETAAP